MSIKNHSDYNQMCVVRKKMIDGITIKINAEKIVRKDLRIIKRTIQILFRIVVYVSISMHSFFSLIHRFGYFFVTPVAIIAFQTEKDLVKHI